MTLVCHAWSPASETHAPFPEAATARDRGAVLFRTPRLRAPGTMLAPAVLAASFAAGVRLSEVSVTPMTRFLRGMLSGRRAAIEDAQRLSAIRRGTSVHGPITADPTSALLVEGVLNGDIHGNGVVFVAVGGEVRGSIEAREVIVAGEVFGDVTAHERCEVHGTGLVLGAMRTGACLILEGARVSGRMLVGEPDGKALEVFEALDAGGRKAENRDSSLRLPGTVQPPARSRGAAVQP
jgi:cytoskeletal protein CcmA (bactofilin family)